MFFACRDITKSYGKKPVLRGVSLTVETGELVSVIGPSGAGKTTFLNILAGLDRPDSGELRFAAPPSKDRPVIMVFQDYLLFPNMTVFDNAAFGLKARKMKKAEIERRVCDALSYFQIADRARAYPDELSGGQKQRLAIARAMVVEPSLLLLDEPFANLDPNLKQDAAAFIKNAQERFGVTTVAVTHDLEEAFVMSGRIAIMLDGELAVTGTPEEIHKNPGNLEAARFLGPVNRIPASLRLSPDRDRGFVSDGDLYLLPRDLGLAKDPKGEVRIASRAFTGRYYVYRIDLADGPITVHSLQDGLAPGDRARLFVRPGPASNQSETTNKDTP